MTHVLVLYNAEKPGAEACAEDLVTWMRERAEVEVRPLDDEPVGEDVELIVVLGGDGSLLNVARLLGDRPVPVAGINLGKLGFLADFTADQFRDRFEAILAGELPVSRRLMLSVACERGGEALYRNLVLNDVVVAGGKAQRMVGVEAAIDGESVTTYFGDGVIVATPTGSTAYCLAAGGPILMPGLEAMVLVPISPHSLTHRPLVARPDAEIVLVPTDLQPEAVCVLDGQEMVPLAPGDRVVVRKAKAVFHLVHGPDRGTFTVLNQKLHWGHLPRYSGRTGRPEAPRKG